MAQLGQQIEKLRYKLGMSQTDLGKLLGTTAMSVSRWERDVNLPESRELLALGLLARKAGMYGWCFWQEAGLSRADARAALGRDHARAAVAGRR